MVIMRDRAHSDLPDKTLYLIYKVGLCLIIFSLVELVKTLSCRLLSLRVNAESMFEDLQVRRQQTTAVHIARPSWWLSPPPCILLPCILFQWARLQAAPFCHARLYKNTFATQGRM